MLRLKGWMRESIATKNKYLSQIIVDLYGHPPPGEPKLYGYGSKNRNAYFHYNPGPGPRIWAPVVALQFFDRAGELLYQTVHYYSTECPIVGVADWLMIDTDIGRHIYQVPIDVLRKTTKVEPVVVASSIHPQH
jgi:hypothetical protein